MQVSLEITTGPAAGKRLVLQTGEAGKVGRVAEANLVVPHDTLMSNLHFQVECTEAGCRFKDLNSRFGTLLNKAKATDAELNDGDQITAGQTTFVVRIRHGVPSTGSAPAGAMPVAATPARAATPVAGPKKDRVLQVLRGQPEGLFAVVDAARDPKVLELLRPSKEKHQSLFEGPQGEILALWAPYLVALPRESAFLEALVGEGWGQSWGIYLTCSRPFEDVRKHLRHFLTVRGDEKDDLFFRYYDPRVLRAFLPVCTAEETSAFFGPIKAFLVEGRRGGALLQFTAGPRGATQLAAAV